MIASKIKAELVCYVVCTILTLGGVGLCMAGLLLPYWYEVAYREGIVIIRVDVGLWHDRVCMGLKECTHHWISDYDRHMNTMIPSGDLIKWFETVGTGFAILSMLTLIYMWTTRKARPVIKILSHILYFTPCMIAAFLSVVGTLILASKGERESTNWAPFMSGIGGALLFMAGCLACVVCRYDPSYGTLENPVSPKYISQ